MPPIKAPYRPRARSCMAQLSVPQIQINGQPLSVTTPPQLSPVRPHSSSFEDFDAVYYNQNHHLGSNLSSALPNDDFLSLAVTNDDFTPQQSPNVVPNQSFFPGYQGTESASTLRALSGVGSLHATYHSVPDYQAQTLGSPSSYVQPHDRHHLDGWHLVTQNNISSSFPQSVAGTSSNNSDEFSFVDPHCFNCRSKEDTVENLKAEIEQLRNEVCSVQQALRKQHAVITSQELYIQELSNVRQPEARDPTRKRSWPMPEQGFGSLEGQTGGELGFTTQVTKRGRFAPQQRKQTAETRRKGACVRCWKHKQRCDPGDDLAGPCKNCQEPNLGAIRLPCIRTHIVDLNLFRCGTTDNDTWTRRDEVEKSIDLTTYASDVRKQLVLTHGFGPTLQVNVRLYHPVRDDATDYVWRDNRGIMQTWRLPPYALSDIHDLTSALWSYIREHRDVYISHFVPREDVPTFEAFSIAQKLAGTEKSNLLQDALDLWMAARLIEKPWQICGEERLGLQHENRWWWIPVTPIMDTQLDQIVIKRFLLPLKKKVLHGLQVHIEKAARKGWLEILATIVILLNTIEEATRHDEEFAAWFGHEFAPGMRRFEDYNLIESYFHSALTLLTHVKVAFDGRLPYLDADTDVSKLMNACQEGDEKTYMIKTDKYVSERHRKSNFERVRQTHQYEASQFWVHQLFIKQWDGQPISIKEKN